MNADKQTPVTEPDIQAYADGQIEPGTDYAEAVEMYLADNPDTRARVQAYRCQDDAIRARYRRILAEPVPDRLRPGALRAAGTGPVRQRVSTPLRLAAGVAALGCAAVIGWQAGQPPEAPLERFADRTTDYLATGDGTGPDSEQVSLESLSALGGAPDFATEGLALVDARQMDNGDMYEARYQDTAGRELQLFVAPDPQRHDNLLYRTREDGRKVVYWQQGPLMYALTGDFSERHLDDLADAAIEKLQGELHGNRFADSGRDPAPQSVADESIEIPTGVADLTAPDPVRLQTSQSLVEGELGSPQDGAARVPILDQPLKTGAGGIQ